jgi:predicted exporter
VNRKLILTVYHPKVTASLWLLGIVIISILGSQALSRDWLETGFLALLPVTEQKPEIAKATKQHNELMARKVIWLTGAATSQAAIVQAQQLEQQLQQSGLFSHIVLEFSAQNYRESYQQLFPFRYQLLDPQTKHILTVNPNDLIAQNLEILYSPIGQMQSTDLERDPLLLFSRYFNAQNPIQLDVEQGIVILHDANKFWALLLTDLQDSTNKLDKLETLLDLAGRAQNEVREAGGELMVSGLPLFTAAGAQSGKQEISTVWALCY